MRHGYDYIKRLSIVLDGKARREEKSGRLDIFIGVRQRQWLPRFRLVCRYPDGCFPGVVLFALRLCFMAGRKTDQGHGYIDVIRALVIGLSLKMRDE